MEPTLPHYTYPYTSRSYIIQYINKYLPNEYYEKYDIIKCVKQCNVNTYNETKIMITKLSTYQMLLLQHVGDMSYVETLLIRLNSNIKLDKKEMIFTTIWIKIIGLLHKNDLL